MAVSEADGFVYHNVAFHIDLITRVIGLESLDLLDGLGETHS